MIDVTTAAQKLECHPSYIYTLVQAGRIRHRWKRGRLFIVPTRDGEIRIQPPGTYQEDEK